MTDKITEFLAESKRLEEAATPGPWEHDNGMIRGDSGLYRVADIRTDLEDAAFIAHARSALPRMRRALEAVLREHYRRDDIRTRSGEPICDGCGDEEGWANAYPCRTVRAIESALTEEG